MLAIQRNLIDNTLETFSLVERLKATEDLNSMEETRMLYYIGCHIPRGADCDDGWKCLKGE